MFLAKKPTYKEYAGYFEDIFNKLDQVRPIDFYFGNVTVYGLKRDIEELLELAEYTRSHPSAEFELSDIQERGIDFLEQEIWREFDRLTSEYKRFKKSLDKPLLLSDI